MIGKIIFKTFVPHGGDLERNVPAAKKMKRSISDTSAIIVIP